MTQLTKEQKQKITKAALIIDWDVFQKSQWLISKIEEQERYLSVHKAGEKYLSFLTDEELQDIQKPQPDSDSQKVIQVFQNNKLGEVLTDLINYELKVRKIKITSVQSIIDIESSVKMKNFSPHISHDNSINAENIQSISKVKQDLIIDGDFSPQWGTKVISKEKQSKFTTEEITVRRTSASLNSSPINISQGNITVEQGHAFAGSTTIGDNANFSYNNQLEAQIEIPPK